MKTYAKDHAGVLASVAEMYTSFIELKGKKSDKHNCFHIELLLKRKHFNTDLSLLFVFIDVHSHSRNATFVN